MYELVLSFLQPSIGLESCKLVGHLLLLSTYNTFVMNTLINEYMFISPMSVDIMNDWFMYLNLRALQRQNGIVAHREGQECSLASACTSKLCKVIRYL